MDEKIKALLEQREVKRKEAEARLAKGPDLTQEDVMVAQGLRAECEALSASIKTLTDAKGLSGEFAAMERESRQPVTSLPLPGGNGDGGGQKAAFLGFEQRPAGEATLYAEKARRDLVQIGAGTFGQKVWDTIRTDDYREAFRKYVRLGKEMMTSAEQKLLQEGIDPAGGFLSPDDFQNRLIMRKPTPTRIAGFVSSMNTSRDKMTLPKVNYSADNIYTTGIRITWTGEAPASATVHRVTDPVFGTFTVPIYTAMMSIPVTNDLIEDSVVALEPWLEDRFFETLEILYDDMILNGTGISQPTGILVNPGGADQPAVTTSGSAAALTPDGLINLSMSLPEQYDDNARYVFNKTNTGRQISLLKDADDRYLWGSGLQDSGLTPSWKDRILMGYPTVLSGLMPDVAANSYPIIFGDLRGYFLVRRIGFSIQVLRELYAETNQILLLARVRFGGGLAEPFRLRIQQVAV